jgi:hypothetical protein
MEYMSYEGTQCVEVRCKGNCRVAIMKRNQPTPEYCELVMVMREPNGLLSKHETGMCKPCKSRIVNDGPQSGELEAIYAQDMEQMIACALRAGYPQGEVMMMVGKFIDRRPVRALDEKGRGEAKL